MDVAGDSGGGGERPSHHIRESVLATSRRPHELTFTLEFCVKTQSCKPLIRHRATPSGDLLRLEGSPTIGEQISITGWRSASTRNPVEGGIEGSLAQAEEGFSDQIRGAMASRGRRGVPAREGEQRRDEPRREDQGEQQAPAPQGPVLPPPPPVDYGVFMQGLAQVPVPQAQDHGGPSIMERFKRMSPPSFKGESDPLLAESWMREIEKIFRAIRCAEDDKVTLATYMLQEQADVWWSSLLRTWFEDGTVEVG
ncbi:hypothetical protein Taro_000604 [Colocasia esculenta]|uniref:Uncharacterized protein n=1 Tax=Colocasia esculenta TaxID=4460 RepID=A0A843T8L5_COLES|nr:hypothetical protein [Colocasia esculenta]